MCCWITCRSGSSCPHICFGFCLNQSFMLHRCFIQWCEWESMIRSCSFEVHSRLVLFLLSPRHAFQRCSSEGVAYLCASSVVPVVDRALVVASLLPTWSWVEQILLKCWWRQCLLALRCSHDTCTWQWRWRRRPEEKTMQPENDLETEGTLPYALCRTMRPDQYVSLLYWFASDAPYTTCKKEADVTPEIWSKAVTRLRSILWLWLCKDSEKPLGGPGKVVCIDETFICKKKRAKGGFQGRSTAGTKQIILGMIELDLATRKATGRIFLSEIPDRTKKTCCLHHVMLSVLRTYFLNAPIVTGIHPMALSAPYHPFCLCRAPSMTLAPERFALCLIHLTWQN